jgi:large repetitive protein
MLTLLRAPRRLVLVGCLLLAPTLTRAQNSFSPGGNEYPIAGALPGDQTAPSAAISTSGGYLVWQDNATDGDGLGIRAERLDANLNKAGTPFRVNVQGVGDQEKPQVARLANGGAVFVWQGGKQGFQKIFARFLPPTGTTFSTGDILVNTYTNDFQIDPQVAVLTDGSVVVVWSSYGQDGFLQGIFGQRLSSAGVKLGDEFGVNLYSLNNQRTPAVTALAGGGFGVGWVSELQRGISTVDIYARVFDASGTPIGGEFPVNTVLTNLCANPSMAAASDGGFAVAWSQRDLVTANSSQSQNSTSLDVLQGSNSWDVFARVYAANGAAKTTAVRLNTQTYGDQFAPKISAFKNNFLATWLSLGQDGSKEGVYGQYFTSAAGLMGVEFQVNTSNGSRQLQPAICSDGTNRFLVVWSSFATSFNFDLFAREYDLIQVSITPTAQGGGATVSWNTKPGLIYQVQKSADYSNWTDYGAPRTATGLSDSITVSGGAGAVVYRVVRIY